MQSRQNELPALPHPSATLAGSFLLSGIVRGVAAAFSAGECFVGAYLLPGKLSFIAVSLR